MTMDWSSFIAGASSMCLIDQLLTAGVLLWLLKRYGLGGLQGLLMRWVPSMSVIHHHHRHEDVEDDVLLDMEM